MEAVQQKHICLNCQEVFQGRFCNQCGQKAQHRRLPIKALLHDAMHDVFHFEHKILGTLWMLIRKPGFLTREYIEGRRTQWFPPFRLFLVMSGLFFLITSGFFYENYGLKKTKSDINIEELKKDKTNKKSESTIRFKKGIKNMAENPEAFYDKAWSHGTKSPFFLMPVFAGLLYIFDRRKNKLFFDSLILSMHHHAFSFIILALALTITRLSTNIWASSFIASLFLLPIIHLGASMRRISGQGWAISLFKSSIASLAYALCTLITVVIIFLTPIWLMG